VTVLRGVPLPNPIQIQPTSQALPNRTRERRLQPVPCWETRGRASAPRQQNPPSWNRHVIGEKLGCETALRTRQRATPTSRGCNPIVSCDGSQIRRFWLALHPPYVELEHLDAQLHFSCRSPLRRVDQSVRIAIPDSGTRCRNGDTPLLLLVSPVSDATPDAAAVLLLPQFLHRCCTREPNSHEYILTLTSSHITSPCAFPSGLLHITRVVKMPSCSPSTPSTTHSSVHGEIMIRSMPDCTCCAPLPKAQLQHSGR
jgi:hypothetical protein